jgi:hypothetical protein
MANQIELELKSLLSGLRYCLAFNKFGPAKGVAIGCILGPAGL